MYRISSSPWQPGFPEISWLYASNEEELEAALAQDPQAVLSIKSSLFPGPLHRRAFHHPSLRWFQVGGSGFDHLLPLERDDLVLTNSKGVLAPFLAETALGALLMLNANLDRYRSQQEARVWKPMTFAPLRGKTLLVVGLGLAWGPLAALVDCCDQTLHHTLTERWLHSASPTPGSGQ